MSIKNTVARTRAKRKAGYFFVAHPLSVCVYTREDKCLQVCLAIFCFFN